jgi:hypothetical protein
LAPQKTKVSSVNNKREIFTTSESLDPIEKLEIRPQSIVAVIILLKPFMTTTNRREDKGSPCLNPRELLKKLDRVPLTKMERHTKEMQCAI